MHCANHLFDLKGRLPVAKKLEANDFGAVSIWTPVKPDSNLGKKRTFDEAVVLDFVCFNR